ncbi:MAG TPA: class I SAM-dependent methyltransferase [Terrimicrobiaceae bacterium]|nr:class I SAM-dependent methyltransferase [Terrimicrobiaceae bacterium]
MNGFDRLAPYYGGMEAVLAGQKLARCRNALWPQIPPPRNVLLAGEGHGKFLVEIVRRHPEARVTYLDASPGMHEAARNRLQAEKLSGTRVAFVEADILAWRTEDRYDLIATQFFLDCFPPPQLARAVASLAGALGPGGHWLITDFQIPARGIFRVRAQIIHWMMYRFFRMAVGLPARALVPPDPFLTAGGLVRRHHREFEWGLLYAALWQRAHPGGGPVAP